jgi:thiosulfate/3-mercaptopyruvate sulfurtransferase
LVSQAFATQGGDRVRAGAHSGAVFFNIDEIADPDTPLPHMLPTPPLSPPRWARWASAMATASSPMTPTAAAAAAARVWWMFRVFGHTNVAVLDGFLSKWLKEDRPTESARCGRRQAVHRAHIRRRAGPRPGALGWQLLGHCERCEQ